MTTPNYSMANNQKVRTMKINIRKVWYYSAVGPVVAVYFPLLVLNAGLNWCTERLIDFFEFMQKVTKCFNNEKSDNRPLDTERGAERMAESGISYPKICSPTSHGIQTQSK